jgi:hypothetical protein
MQVLVPEQMLQESAAKVAQFLSEHPNVARVHYPPLLPVDFPARQLMERQSGSAGSTFSFEVRGGQAEAFAFLNRLEGHCQVNRSQNELAPTRPMCGASSRLLDARLLLPDPKGFRPDAAIRAGAEAVTPWPEMAVDDGVRREEILRLAG